MIKTIYKKKKILKNTVNFHFTEGGIHKRRVTGMVGNSRKSLIVEYDVLSIVWTVDKHVFRKGRFVVQMSIAVAKRTIMSIDGV